ncbi:acyl-coenzyme A thioesterase 13 [Punica granatum]|uniref:Acyl-coenzyme A thioesterase 13 n=2 Tax=Punica granatum TaxID=22663 RepID=A0A218WZL0_PUNGR|nr:acyl-coenzyme A thioesterase 13 [Punica granatum]OWM78144.1 hypothetical protein CDL15_Pgr014963 [Punica granatum]PKI52188.1 hypothetical protein CRG98_027431 [Punica granatum]
MEEKQTPRLKESLKWLADLSEGANKTAEFDFLNLQGLRIVRAREGYLLCNFVLPSRLSDGDGNWEAGAMATLIDDVGSVVVVTATGTVKATLDLSISYISPAKVQEEIEIEAKVVGPKGKLALVVVEVKRKADAKLIAIAQQWMASIGLTTSQLSKL